MDDKIDKNAAINETIFTFDSIRHFQIGKMQFGRLKETVIDERYYNQFILPKIRKLIFLVASIFIDHRIF